jgi:oxaloacetate decarboxylase beta subunit
MESAYGIGDLLSRFTRSMGVVNFGYENVIVMAIGCFLIYLGIKKRYEPLLLLPIGFGAILTNVPVIGMMDDGGILRVIYDSGIKTGLFPLLIFLGIGALTDFGPLIADPKTTFLGAAAQFGIFGTLIGALAIGKIPGLGLAFSLPEAGSIAIIGGADGPTAIYTASKMAPDLLGAVAIAAYSYMALVPIIQPPIMRLLTTPEERRIKMKQLREVSKRERVIFPFAVTILCALLVPSATPLIGMLMFGNLLREAGVVERLSKTAQNEMINIVTIFLGLSVGATLQGPQFLTAKTIGILVLGIVAFAIGTASGVLLGKVMCKLSGGRINPLIGAAGVSAVPMAARVVQKEGQKANPESSLLMHAMGPNVTGVIGSAVAAGVLLSMIPH